MRGNLRSICTMRCIGAFSIFTRLAREELGMEMPKLPIYKHFEAREMQGMLRREGRFERGTSKTHLLGDFGLEGSPTRCYRENDSGNISKVRRS